MTEEPLDDSEREEVEVLDASDLGSPNPHTGKQPPAWEAFFNPPAGIEGIPRVHVHRLWPETWPHPVYNREVTTEGFVGEVPHGNEIERYVAERWGGGKYRVLQVVNHRYRMSRQLRIPGPPILQDLNIANSKAAAAAGLPLSSSTDGKGLAVDGIPIDGSDEQFVRMCQRIALVKNMGAPNQPADINQALLAYLLKDREHSNPMHFIGQAIEVFKAMREVAAEAPADSGGLFGLPSSVVSSVLGALLTPRTAPSNGAGNPPPALPAPTKSNPSEEDPMSPSNQLERIREAIDRIVDNYMSPETRQLDPRRLANMLDLVVYVPPALRSQLLAHAQTFADYGWSVLNDLLHEGMDESAAEALSSGWAVYFDSVFKAYADPERKQFGAGL